MVTCTITPCRAAVRLNSGVRPLMKVHRLLIAAITGTICFALSAVAMLYILCTFGHRQCIDGSPFQPWLIGWFWVCATLVLGVTLILNLALLRLRLYRPWLTLLLYPTVAVCTPKIWALLTGSGFSAVHNWTTIDAIFVVPGFVMGLILFVTWHQRPNNSFKPNPLRSGNGAAG